LKKSPIGFAGLGEAMDMEVAKTAARAKLRPKREIEM
jgi:hypothetical protein